LGGQTLAITICASRQPNHVKHLLSGLSNLLKGTFPFLVLLPGDSRGVRCSHFLVLILPRDFVFCPLTGISARGPQGRSDRHGSEAEFALLGLICSLVSRHRPYFGREDHELTASCVPKFFCYSTKFRSLLFLVVSLKRAIEPVASLIISSAFSQISVYDRKQFSWTWTSPGCQRP
jgi:hypothetical protein